MQMHEYAVLACVFIMLVGLDKLRQAMILTTWFFMHSREGSRRGEIWDPIALLAALDGPSLLSVHGKGARSDCTRV